MGERDQSLTYLNIVTRRFVGMRPPKESTLHIAFDADTGLTNANKLKFKEIEAAIQL